MFGTLGNTETNRGSFSVFKTKGISQTKGAHLFQWLEHQETLTSNWNFFSMFRTLGNISIKEQSFQ